MAKNKKKTHKATSKRFRITASGKVEHLPQGSGNGHSRGYMKRREKKAKTGKNMLQAKGEVKKIKSLVK